MKDRKGFGSRIRAAREIAKITIENAAELCDVAVITWKQYESGQRLPSIPKLIKICLTLRVKPEYLLGPELDGLQDNGNEMEMLKLQIEQLGSDDVAIVHSAVSKILEVRKNI